MEELFKKLNECIKANKDAVLVTVVASSGSTPRGAGARMLITKEGRVSGTIGGGAVEYQSELMAKNVLEEKKSKMEMFLLRKNQVQDLGMICGGDVHVYFHFISAKDEKIKELLDEIEEMYQERESCWLITDVTQDQTGQFFLFGKERGEKGGVLPKEVLDALEPGPMQIEAAGHIYYCEKLIQEGTVYIFGGGHVAQALVPALVAVDFQCIVLEDREEFCKEELFPGVFEVRLIENRRLLEKVDIKEDDYVCVMTRGHKDDRIVQLQILQTPANYIGVIGSKRKTAGVFQWLKEQGVPQDELQRIKTPIGLEIMAETPAEIAVSITAELILHRAKRMA